MEISILQTDFIDSPQLLSQGSIIGGQNSYKGFAESDFQKFFDKASVDINNIMPNDIVRDTANSEATAINSVEMSASLLLSILGLNPDIAELNSNNIDLINPIGDGDLENVTAIDFLKNLGFSEDNAKAIVAQVVSSNQQFEGGDKTNVSNQISCLFGRQLSQIDYTGSLNKNVIPESYQENIPEDSLQMQKSLEDIKDIVSDKLKLNPHELKFQVLSDKKDLLDKIFDNKIFSKKSGNENLKILDGFPDNNSSAAESEDIAINNRVVKAFNNHKLIEKQESLPMVNGEKTVDSDSLNLDKSYPENRELSVKYAPPNTDLKGFDSASIVGTENISQSSKTSLSNSVINQIVENAQIIIKGDKKEIKMHLDPPSLGSIHMKVTMDSHTIKATMIADTPYVKEVIESNLNELRRSLADSGINVEQFSVFVGQDYKQNNTEDAQIYHSNIVNLSDAIGMTDKKEAIIGIINSQNIINIFA